MLLYRPGEDKDVVQVDHHYTLGDEILEDVIHHHLEGSQAVGHPKEHHKRLKQAAISIEGSLPLIARFDTYVIKLPLDIKLGKVLGPVKL